MDQTLTSIPARVRQLAASKPADIALRTKHRGIWKAISRAQFETETARIGSALLSLDFGRGDVAAVLSETRPEVAYADLAILGAGAATLAMHPEDDADRVAHMLSSGGARLAFVENDEQLDKILSIRERCPALGRIVVFDMKGLREFSDAGVVSLESFRDAPVSDDWAASVASIAADQPAVLHFSRCDPSGFGRVLTHGDLIEMTQAASARFSLQAGDERLSVLRMTDMTERVWGLYLGLLSGCVTNYPERYDTALENLRELQPTVLGADANFFDRLHELVTERAKAATRVQRAAYDWALRAGAGGGLLGSLANGLVLRAVRREFGLSRLRHACVGGAEPGEAAMAWAHALGIAIQRVDAPAPGADQPDSRTLTLMQNAYA